MIVCWYQTRDDNKATKERGRGVGISTPFNRFYISHLLSFHTSNRNRYTINSVTLTNSFSRIPISSSLHITLLIHNHILSLHSRFSSHISSFTSSITRRGRCHKSPSSFIFSIHIFTDSYDTTHEGSHTNASFPHFFIPSILSNDLFNNSNSLLRIFTPSFTPRPRTSNITTNRVSLTSLPHKLFITIDTSLASNTLSK